MGRGEEASSQDLEDARRSLESVSEPFARRRMERALRSGMAGKSLAEVEGELAEEEDLRVRRGGHAPEKIDPL